MAKAAIKPGQYVVVTTSHRGVFAGTFVSREDNEVVLNDARVCVYWNAEVKGFVGLAVTGPNSKCRISAPCPTMAVGFVTAILVCTSEAQAAWEKSPWQS